jgi:hypothetical protein
MANQFPQSQRTASIALSVVGCIDYLAYGAIFTRAVFPFVAKEAKKWVFWFPQKAQDVCREEVYHTIVLSCCWFCAVMRAAEDQASQSLQYGIVFLQWHRSRSRPARRERCGAKKPWILVLYNLWGRWVKPSEWWWGNQSIELEIEIRVNICILCYLHVWH